MSIKWFFIWSIQKKVVLLQPQKPERVPDIMLSQED